MSPVEMIALLIAVLGLIKLVVIVINPHKWIPVIRSVYGNPIVTKTIVLLLAAVILKYLLVEITIVQIYAAAAFMVCIIAFNFSTIGEEMIGLSEKLMREGNIIKKFWPSMLLSFVLSIWVIIKIIE